jgi:tRNA threonylcarbamoyladenosine biosynthesis protein TsaE
LHSPAETYGLGVEWGEQAGPGWVFGLIGELGAGKTQLVKGLAEGLGFTGRVHSPTFALVNEYRQGRLPLFHVDLYRLETPEAIQRAGLEEYLFSPAGVTAVEWFEHLAGLVPAPQGGNDSGPIPRGRLRRVLLETLSETERRLSYEDIGA